MNSSDPARWTRDLDDLLDGGAVAPLTDAEPLARFVAGEGDRADRALAALVQRHGSLVRGVCRRVLSDPGDADDAFQATFLVLVRRAGSVRLAGADSLARWLHGVSRRVAARTRVDRARRRRREGDNRLAARTAGAPPDPAVAEALAALDDEVARLAEPFRSAIVLCDLGGLTHEQAAGALGCPVGTVKSRLGRGRDRLRARLLARGFRPDAAASSGGLGLVVPRSAVPPDLVARVARVAGILAATGPGTAALLSARWFVPVSLGGDLMRSTRPLPWLAGAALAAGVVTLGWFRLANSTPPQQPPPAATSAPKVDPPPHSGPMPLTVEVRDLRTDAPVAGRGIRLQSWGTGAIVTAPTDADGMARFTLVPPGWSRSSGAGTGPAPSPPRPGRPTASSCGPSRASGWAAWSATRAARPSPGRRSS